MYVKLLMAGLISFVLVVLVMPYFIKYLQSISLHQNVSEYSLPEYRDKAKTPIMGGVMFVVVPIIVTICFGISFKDIDTIIVMLSFIGYSLIGFVDDLLIVTRNNNEGLLPRYKLLWQIVLAIIFFMLYSSSISLTVEIPVIHYHINLSYLYALLIFFMLVGSSNAVNLTDGMDGLAAGCMFFALIPFLIIAFINGYHTLSLFIISLIGALVGYLKFNVSPAKIYMGDTGSLALGAVLAAISIVLKKEILLIIVGGIFVWETLCVIIQISSVKLFGKRVFKYTPIHYSFVLDGISEKRVVKSFWILAMIFSFVGLIIGLI